MLKNKIYVVKTLDTGEFVVINTKAGWVERRFAKAALTTAFGNNWPSKFTVVELQKGSV